MSPIGLSVRAAQAGRTDGAREGEAAGGRGPASKSPRVRSGRRAERLAPYVLVAPAVLIIVVLRLWPLGLGVNFSFTGDGERNGTTVGLDNYAELIDDPLFRTALRNVGLLVLLPAAIPGLLATFIYLRVPGHPFFRSVYDGPLNAVLGSSGVGPVDWLGDPDAAIFAVVGVHIWATSGMALVVFLAGFATLARHHPGSVTHHPVRRRHHDDRDADSMFGLLHVMTSGGPEGSTYLPGLGIRIDETVMTAARQRTAHAPDGPHIRPEQAGRRLLAVTPGPCRCTAEGTFDTMGMEDR